MTKKILLKIPAALLLLFHLTLSFGAYSQNTKRSVGNVKSLKENFNPTAEANARKGSLTLGDHQVNFNFNKQVGTSQVLRGQVTNMTDGRVNLEIVNNKLSGVVFSVKEKKAFKYTTDNSGNVLEEFVDIHDVLCIDYGTVASVVADKSSTSSAPAPQSMFVGNWNQQQSKPGSPNVIYIDFDGETVPAGTGFNLGAAFTVAASTLTNAERGLVWEYVSEDYAPFDVNVTTDRSVYNAAAPTQRTMSIVTPTTSYMLAFGAAGEAFLNTFGTASPAFCYLNDIKHVTSVVSHEVGHTLNLTHDGIAPNFQYYNGNGTFSPIMGSAATASIEQWSRGEYSTASSNHQDDISILGSRLGFRADEIGSTPKIEYFWADFGEALSSPKELTVQADGTVSGNIGYITNPQDVDAYSFTIPANTYANVQFLISVAERGANLNTRAKLYYNGNVLLISDDISSLNSSLKKDLEPGIYYILVEGVADNNNLYVDYGSLGYYSITGKISSSKNDKPLVYITSPAINASLPNKPFTITAEATSKTSTISSVQFYDGTVLLGTDNTSPYTFTTTSQSIGNHSITAKATAANGSTNTSVPVAVNIVDNKGSGTISYPANGSIAQFYSQCNFTLNNPTQTITKVEFLLDRMPIRFYVTTYYDWVLELVGTNLTATTVYFDNLPAGPHTLTLRITESSGIVTEHSPVTFTWKKSVFPEVSLTSPTDNTSMTAPAVFNLAATASDADGTINSVQFYNDNTLLNTDNTAPYSFSWTNVPKGIYTVRALAIDNSGYNSWSSPITLVSGSLPTVTLTAPTTNTLISAAPATVNLTATAADADGTVNRVEFYNGTTLIGTDATAPYTFSWTNVQKGRYSITAKAIDNDGFPKSSTESIIQIGTPPIITIISPAAHSSFEEISEIKMTIQASDADGTVMSYMIYCNDQQITDYSWRYPTAQTIEFTFKNLIGSYILTCKAIDNNGLIGSDFTRIYVTPAVNKPPVLNIISPVNNSNLQNNNVVVNYYAGDVDGSIAAVKFYVNNNLVTNRLDYEARDNWPFEWVLRDGNNSYYIEAIDNNGAVTRSATQNIVVRTRTVTITSPLPATIYSPGSIVINATVSDPATVTKVEFYNGSTLLGSDLTSPYAFTWASVPSGTYTLKAVATDNLGLVTSSTVTIYVNAAGTACITSFEPNESTATATLLSEFTTINSSIYHENDKDYYKINLPYPEVLTVTVTLDQLDTDLDLQVVGENGFVYGASAKSGTASETVTVDMWGEGVYILVSGYNLAKNTACYRLTNSYTRSCSNSFEPNETTLSATVLQPNTSVNAAIAIVGDKDYYKIDLTSTSYVSLLLNNLVHDCDVTLYNAAGTVLGSSVATGTTAEQILNKQLTAGSYYVLVNSKTTGDARCYQLRNIVSPASAASCLVAQDNNDMYQFATAFNTNSTTNSSLPVDNDQDYFKIVIPQDGTLNVTLSNLTVYTSLSLLRSTPGGITTMAGSDNYSTVNATVIQYVTAGTYYVKVSSSYGNYSNSCYTLTNVYTTGAQCTDTYEPNESQAAAKAMPLNTVINANIANTTEVDWFTFTTTAPNTNVIVLLDRLQYDFDLLVTDGVTTSTSTRGGILYDRVTINSAVAKTFYVKVYGYNGAFTGQCYELSANTSNIAARESTADFIAEDHSGKESYTMLKLYPNPVEKGKQLNIEMSNPENADSKEIRIYNSSGLLVSKQIIEMNGSSAILDLSNLSPGIYLLDAGENGKKAFIVQ